MSLFEKGRPKTGGRAKGVKNRLSYAFLEALEKDFAEGGADAIKIARIERPVEYAKMIAGLLPRELEITETTLMQIDDRDLDTYIELIRRTIAQRALGIGVRTTETEH
jgi:hypothetical protein